MAKNYEFEKVRVPWWTDMIMYWLEDQVAIAFHCIHHPSADRESIITSLELNKLNQFLQPRGFELISFTQDDLPHPSNMKVPVNSGKDMKKSTINDPIGKYLFSSPSDQETIVIGFFHIKMLDMFHPIQGMNTMQGSSETHGGGESNARQVVNIINANLEKLRQDGNIPIVAAMPNWLGGTTCFIHGCSFTPIPVRQDDPNGHWTFTLPELPDTMQARKGKDVTVFVLDTLPKLDQVKNASQNTDSNWLLRDIVAGMEKKTISLNYQTLPKLLQENAADQLVTGRDIYGHTAGLPMSDHGLFVAGILHDLARDAKIECIRILNDFGAGDTHMLIHELEKIHNRMTSPNPHRGDGEGDLHNKAVVINLSLVLMPPRDDLPGLWFSDSGNSMEDLTQIARGIELLQTPFHLVIQSLTALGAVIVASAGNDSNTPDMPYRPEARYPAGFPEVISVGAVDQYDAMTPYSDYPSLPPHHNGIVTYGAGLATPVPPKSKHKQHAPAFPLYGPGDSETMTTATNVDPLRGIYTAPVYPKLSADDPRPYYDAPTTTAWAYWSGTSFATPIISALAARVLESMKSSNMELPSRYLAAEVQWAITTPEGQLAMLGKALPIQSEFGVSLLKAVQKLEAS